MICSNPPRERGETEEKMRRIIAALCLVMMLVSAASAEDFLLGVEPEKTEIIRAYRSEHRPEHTNCN